jgi:hypothetical protein
MVRESTMSSVMGRASPRWQVMHVTLTGGSARSTSFGSCSPLMFSTMRIMTRAFFFSGLSSAAKFICGCPLGPGAAPSRGTWQNSQRTPSAVVKPRMMRSRVSRGMSFGRTCRFSNRSGIWASARAGIAATAVATARATTVKRDALRTVTPNWAAWAVDTCFAEGDIRAVQRRAPECWPGSSRRSPGPFHYGFHRRGVRALGDRN